MLTRLCLLSFDRLSFVFVLFISFSFYLPWGARFPRKGVLLIEAAFGLAGCSGGTHVERVCHLSRSSFGPNWDNNNNEKLPAQRAQPLHSHSKE